MKTHDHLRSRRAGGRGARRSCSAACCGEPVAGRAPQTSARAAAGAPARRLRRRRHGAPDRRSSSATCERNPDDAALADPARARAPAAHARDGRRRRYFAALRGGLRRALELAPADDPAVSGARPRSRASQHRFRDALALGTPRAPRSHRVLARHLGILGDALVELGRYDEAFATFDRMVALKPSARLLRARLLRPRAARRRRRRRSRRWSSRSTRPAATPEPTAWTHVELGNLHFDAGRAAPRGARIPRGARRFPGLRHRARGRAGPRRGRARPDRRGALALSRRAVDAVPLPQYVGHARRPLAARAATPRRRDAVRARRRDERLRARTASAPSSRPRSSTSTTGSGSRDALARARAALRERPSIEADDVLAWALVRNGRCEEALRYSQRALRLGTRDAPSSSTAAWPSAASAAGGRRAAFRARARPQPALLPALGTRREGGRREAASSLLLALAALAAARRRARASARQLHDQPLHADRRLGRPRLRALRARPRRDPDVPGALDGSPARPRALRGRASRPGCAAC